MFMFCVRSVNSVQEVSYCEITQTDRSQGSLLVTCWHWDIITIIIFRGTSGCASQTAAPPSCAGGRPAAASSARASHTSCANCDSSGISSSRYTLVNKGFHCLCICYLSGYFPHLWLFLDHYTWRKHSSVSVSLFSLLGTPRLVARWPVELEINILEVWSKFHYHREGPYEGLLMVKNLLTHLLTPINLVTPKARRRNIVLPIQRHYAKQPLSWYPNFMDPSFHLSTSIFAKVRFHV